MWFLSYWIQYFFNQYRTKKAIDAVLFGNCHIHLHNYFFFNEKQVFHCCCSVIVSAPIIVWVCDRRPWWWEWRFRWFLCDCEWSRRDSCGCWFSEIYRKLWCVCWWWFWSEFVDDSRNSRTLSRRLKFLRRLLGYSGWLYWYCVEPVRLHLISNRG